MAAAVLALTACETIQPVETPAERPSGGVSVGGTAGASFQVSDSIVFTASLGAHSKTYLDYNGYSYDLLWKTGDQILIWDADSLYKDYPQAYEFCSINDGIGSSSANFLGTLQAENYVALYADSYQYPIDGCPAITLPVDQYLWLVYNEYNLGSGAYPMVAVSNDKNFEFQNLCSILKVSITGDGQLLNGVTVEAANGEPMAGSAIVYQDGADFRLRFLDDKTSSYVKFWGGVNLSSEPVDCFIVVPAQTYEGGFNISVFTDCGTKELSTGARVTTERSKFYNISIDVELESISYLLGDYTMTAESYWDGPMTWTMSINESHDDTREVWFLNLSQGLSLQETRFYGIVSEDGRTITIPFAQETEYIHNNGYPITLYGFDGEEAFPSGALVVEVYRDQQSVTLDFGEEMGMGFYIHGENGGWWDLLFPGINAVKD